MTAVLTGRVPGTLQRARTSSDSWEGSGGSFDVLLSGREHGAPIRRYGSVKPLLLYHLESDPLFGLSFPSIKCGHSSLLAPLSRPAAS